MAAGYSGTPLVQKLGIRSGQRILVQGAPAPYASIVEGLPGDVDVRSRATGVFDVVHVFCADRRDLATRLPRGRGVLARDGALWVSWPKKASGVVTDLTGDVVREAGLAAGLVDVKVCAVDDTWSGLKFVVRVKDR